MPVTPEREKPQIPEGVEEIPEEVEIPPHIEKGGVSASKTQFSKKVHDDDDTLLTESPKTKKVEIKLPETEERLSAWEKGKVSDSLTWFASFWLRMIKKATHFGWRIIGGKQK